jgi:hypothetical protein
VRTSPPFDPYGLFEALDRERIGFVVIGGFARVVHGSAETTNGVDIVPSMREESLRRLIRVLDELRATAGGRGHVQPEQLVAAERLALETTVGSLTVVPTPWGTRGYDGLRIRANHENLGRGIRPAIASIVDLAGMLDASPRPQDVERLQRLQRMMELERRLMRDRRLSRGPAVEL